MGDKGASDENHLLGSLIFFGYLYYKYNMGGAYCTEKQKRNA
jgi:hypothetical protein